MNLDNKISIVIPCYNTYKYIAKCIESVRNQSYKNIELIVVDDGSDDITKLILQELSSKIDLLIIQENKGQSTARNIGIKEAEGKYILALDSDDFLEPTFCEKAVERIQKDRNYKIIASYSNILYENSKKACLYKPAGGGLIEMLLNNTAMGSCMFRKIDWETSGGYDQAMRNGFEDWEFYIRLLNKTGRVEIISENLFNYRKHINSTTTKANKIKYDLLRYIYYKHEGVYKVYFKDFIDFLLNKIEKEEKEKIKMYSRMEYKIGFKVLQPLRFIKRVFNV